jgi:hypothetical protein
VKTNKKNPKISKKDISYPFTHEYHRCIVNTRTGGWMSIADESYSEDNVQEVICQMLHIFSEECVRKNLGRCLTLGELSTLLAEQKDVIKTIFFDYTDSMDFNVNQCPTFAGTDTSTQGSVKAPSNEAITVYLLGASELVIRAVATILTWRRQP